VRINLHGHGLLDKTNAHNQFAPVVVTQDDSLHPFKYACSNPYPIADSEVVVRPQFRLPLNAEPYRVDLFIAYRG
jgi:hypothetical protein